jgi:uncharacterized protein YycO
MNKLKNTIGVKPKIGTNAILLFKGRGIISTLIRWQTRSPYSHAAILLADGSIVESWQGKGVRGTELHDWKNVDVFYVPSATNAQWFNVVLFMLNRIGKGYDYWGVLRFITRTNMPPNDKWFCSEIVFEAFQEAGINLLERIDPWEVSPGLLSLSPLLVPESQSTKKSI